MQVILRFLFAALLCLPGVSAGQSKSEQFLNLTVEVKLGTDDDPGPPSIGEGLKWDLSAAKKTWCELTIFTNSSHPGGNPLDIYNENNGGLFIKCSKNRDSILYTFFGGVDNSRDGNTFVWGPGFQFRTPRSWGLYAGIGGELALTYYSINGPEGVRRALKKIPPSQLVNLGYIPQGKRGYAIFPLPILVYQVGYAFENEHFVANLALVERNLAGAARLRGIEMFIIFRHNVF